jgi:alpha-tubulin suppressor-like RCC1 family protein
MVGEIVRGGFWGTLAHSPRAYASGMRSSSFALPFLFVFACISDDAASRSTLPRFQDAGGNGVDGSREPDASSNTDAATLAPLKAVLVSAGHSHTCALRTQPGEVVCWGSNGHSELGSPSAPSSSLPIRVALMEKATGVSVGKQFACATLESGKMVCWGTNESGQLGRAPFQPFGSPATVTPSDPTVNPESDPAWNLPLNTFTPLQMTLGSGHTCTWQALGGSNPAVSVPYCWGSNAVGQLHRSDVPTPPYAKPLVPTVDATFGGAGSVPFYASHMSAGDDFTCEVGRLPAVSGLGLTSERVLCFGAEGKNQLGKVELRQGEARRGSPLLNANASPLLAPTLLASGSEHACVVAAKVGGGSALYCWGSGTKGQIGRALDTDATGVAHLVSTVGVPVLLDAGGSNTCMKVDGNLRCMGAANAGQLGDGTVDDAAHATPSTIALTDVTSLSVGAEHVCAIVGGGPATPGTVYCWGNNRNGQLGDGMDLTTGYGALGPTQFVRGTPVAVRDL